MIRRKHMIKDKQKKVPAEFQQLYEKIDRIIGLLTAILYKEKTVGEKAFYLRQLGFSNKKIADLLETTSGTIAVELHKYLKRRSTSNVKVKKR